MLHVIHLSFEKGANESGWNLGNTLHSLWQMFHDTPAKKKISFKLQAVICFPFDFVRVDE